MSELCLNINIFKIVFGKLAIWENEDPNFQL